MKTVIFICTGNTCRSPMAKALFEQKIEGKGQDFTAISRGLSVLENSPAANNAIEALKEFKADLTSHKATMLSIDDVASADLFVCMTEEHKRVLTSTGVSESKIEVLGIPDPYMCGLAVYKECAKDIYNKLDNVLLKLNGIEISPMPLCDAQKASEIEKISFDKEAWSEKSIVETINSGGCYFAAYKEGEMLGVVGVKQILDEAYISNISVLPQYRRMGIANALMNALTQHLKQQNAAFVTLEVRESNIGAIALYEKLGFQLKGVRKNFYESPKEDARIMTLDFR